MVIEMDTLTSFDCAVLVCDLDYVKKVCAEMEKHIKDFIQFLTKQRARLINNFISVLGDGGEKPHE